MWGKKKITSSKAQLLYELFDMTIHSRGKTCYKNYALWFDKNLRRNRKTNCCNQKNPRESSQSPSCMQQALIPNQRCIY